MKPIDGGRVSLPIANFTYVNIYPSALLFLIMKQDIQLQLNKQLSDFLGTQFATTRYYPASGGHIHQSLIIEGNGQRYFVKTNQANALPMFISESNGLKEISNSHTVRVPRPLIYGNNEDYSWLVMEYLPLTKPTLNGMSALGEQLARLHKVCQGSFGWHSDNYIGSSVQKNRQAQSWPDFWRDQRLAIQLALAAKNGYRGKLQSQGEHLLDKAPIFFKSYIPKPSLLHGDLWGGNIGFINGREPVIFDPAVYYGDRETDLAMTELFGGFAKEFYQTYEEHFPLDNDYKLRKRLYNLYHVLNHLNLFGGSYLHQAQHIIESLLAEIS